MVAGGVRRARPRATPNGGSPSASPTTSRARASPTTRRWTSSRPTRCERCSSASAPTGPSAPTRTRSRSSAPSSICTPRATSSTTRRSPGRRPCRTCASGPSRSERRIWSTRRASSAATSSGCSSAPRSWAAPRRGATLLLNFAASRRRGLGRAGPAHPGADPRQGDRAVRDRRRPDRPRGGTRRADQHRAADLLLRHLRGAGARRGDRPDQGGDRQELRPARRQRSSRRTSEPSIAPSTGWSGSRYPTPATSSDRAALRSCPAHAPGVRPEGHRHDDGRPRRRAAGQRPAGGRHLAERHRGLREAQDLRARRPVGSRPVHPVRQLQLRLPAQRHPLEVLRPVAAGRRTGRLPLRAAAGPGAPRHRLHPAGLRGRLHRLRAVRRGLPGAGPDDPSRKAINLAPLEPLGAAERDNIAFFETLPVAERSRVDFGTVRGTQFLQPLFEFSGACAGCGETPYLKLLSQLFGDRAVIANATGCSSIYGGNLPTTPWTTNADGRGPAWSNSLFEDNAEFGLGLRLAADRHLELARRRLGELRDELGAELVDAILDAPQLLRVRASTPSAQRVAELERRLAASGRACGCRPGERRRPPRPAQRVDRRRRRLGLRHRLRRARPRPRQRAQRQRARARHRGVLEHRRADVQGDAARGRRQVRGRAARPSRRRISPCRRSPTAASTWPGSRWAPIPNRRCGLFARRRRTTARRW